MRKSQMLVLLLVAGAILMLRPASWATIVGGPHDFSAETWNTSGEICKVCHTPHNAEVGPAPLWNHETTVATFTPYTSDTLDATVGQPEGVSKACLSCHDGTVALDSFGGAAGTEFMSPGDHLLGTDLRDDHPISMTYDAALVTADGGLNDPSTLPADVRLFGSKVQCGTCHDVHGNRGYAASSAKLLVVNNSGSALCLTCHDK